MLRGTKQTLLEGIAVSVLAIVVVGLTIGIVETADVNGAMESGTGHYTILEGGTCEDDESGIVGEFVLEGEVHRNVEGNFRVVIRSRTTDRNTGDGGTIVLVHALEEHVHIETGSYAEIIAQADLIAGAHVEAVRVEGVSGGLAALNVLAVLNNVHITGTRNDLCKGLGAKEHQGCCKKTYKKLFHSYLENITYTNFEDVAMKLVILTRGKIQQAEIEAHIHQDTL